MLCKEIDCHQIGFIFEEGRTQPSELFIHVEFRLSGFVVGEKRPFLCCLDKLGPLYTWEGIPSSVWLPPIPNPVNSIPSFGVLAFPVFNNLNQVCQVFDGLFVFHLMCSSEAYCC